MEQWWLLLILAGLIAVPAVVNQQYTAKTGKASLNREIAVRVWMTGIMALGIAITTDQLVSALIFFFLMSLGLSLFAVVGFPAREKAYRATYERNRKQKR